MRYCLNNPLVYTDPSGEFIFTLLASVIPGAQFLLPLAISTDIGWMTGGMNSVASGGTFWDGAWKGAVTGAISGATSYLGVPGIIPGGIVQSGASVGVNGITNLLDGDKFFDNWGMAAISGFASGAYSGYKLSDAGRLNYWWGTSQENWGHNRGQWSIAWWDEQRSVDFIANPNAVPYYGENTCVPTSNCMTHGDREFEFNSDNLRSVRMSDCNYENTFYQLDGYQQNGFKKAHLIADNYGKDLVGHEMAVHKVTYRSKNFWGRESFNVLAYDPGVRYYTLDNGIKVFKPISLVKYNFLRLPFSFIRFTLYNN